MTNCTLTHEADATATGFYLLTPVHRPPVRIHYPIFSHNFLIKVKFKFIKLRPTWNWLTIGTRCRYLTNRLLRLWNQRQKTKDERVLRMNCTCCWTMSWNEQRMMCESPSSSKAHGHSYDESPEQIDSTKTKEKMKQKPPSRLIVDASGADRPIKSRRMASKITETNGSVHRTNLKNVVAVVPVENFGKNKKRKSCFALDSSVQPETSRFPNWTPTSGCWLLFFSLSKRKYKTLYSSCD